MTEHVYNATGERVSTITYHSGYYDTSLLIETDTLTEAELVTWVGLYDLSQTQRIDYSYDFRGNLATSTTYASIDTLGNGMIDGSERTASETGRSPPV